MTENTKVNEITQIEGRHQGSSQILNWKYQRMMWTKTMEEPGEGDVN